MVLNHNNLPNQSQNLIGQQSNYTNFFQGISPYSPFAPRRRGRRPKDFCEGFSAFSNHNQSYYMSIKACVMNHVPPFDKSTMTETEDFHEFNINVETREQLIHSVKSTAARAGFRAILPFSDRCNRTTAITYFCCSLSGKSNRK